MIDYFWPILILVVGLDLLFAAVRSSLVNARLPQLLDLREKQPAQADRVLKLLERARLRASLRLMVVISHAMLVWVVIWGILGQPGENSNQVSNPQPGFGWVLLAGIGSAIVMLALEFIVERIILRQPETYAVRLAWAGKLVDLLLSPISAVLTGLHGSPAILERRLGSVTEDELRTWVEVGQPEGGLEKDERRMIYSIFQFGDTLCREIMVPRVEVLALEVDTPLGEAIQQLIDSGHSRVPVYAEDIDNVIGLLYAKDLLRVVPDRLENASLRSLLRQAYFVPESKKVDDLLSQMQDRNIHFAVVVDEYGGMAGIVTLEDIVEQIVGEIRDEYDQGEELPYQQVGPGEYLFSGRIDVDDLNEILDTDLTREQADTLAGYIYGQIGRVPSGGEQVRLGEWTFTVEQVSGRRIRKVRAQLTSVVKEGEA